MPEETKRGRGRPRQGDPIIVRLSDDQLAWVDRQPGNRSEVLRRLVAQAMEAEQH